MSGERTVISKKLIDNQIAIETTGTILGPALCSQAREWTFYVYFRPGTTAGNVKIEAAHDAAFTGTWAQLGSTVDWTAADRVHFVSITGVHLAMRARISTAADGVVGAGIDVFVVGR